MGSFFQKLCAKKLLPVVWTLLTIFLLCVPGSSLPGEDIAFEIPYFDKYVHIALFGGIALFWGGHYAFRLSAMSNWRKMVIWMALFSMGLGIALEFAQLFWIPDRSFDGFDIVADTTGALLAALFLLFVYPGKKVRS